ncbi:TPA: hypothetical protein NJ118_004606 [Vibrio parahaemolyticus]|nr:hypothetical protein [Vibrio parahaemolyticus]
MKVKELQAMLSNSNPEDEVVCVIEENESIEGFIKAYKVKNIEITDKYEKCSPKFKDMNAAIRASESPSDGIALITITHEF